MSQNNIRHRQTQEMTNPLQRSGNFIKNPGSEEVTDKQKKALLLSLLAGEPAHFYTDTLSTGWEPNRAKEFLLQNLKIKNRESAQASIDFSFYEGERTTYNILLPHLLENTSLANLLGCLEKRYLCVSLLQTYAKNLYKGLHKLHSHPALQVNRTNVVKGILAWDTAHAILIARLSWDAGYFTREEALENAETAVDLCKSLFNDWENIAKSFIIGEAMRSGTNPDFGSTIEIVTRILSEKESPWRETGW